MKEDVFPEAKSKLIDIIKRESEISVEDGAEELDLAKTTIRQHLVALESKGFVTSRSERHGRGRPRKLYGLTEKAEQFFESRELEFLMGLVNFLFENGREEVVEDFIDELARKLRDGLEVDHLPPRERLQALEDLATRQGFMACASRQDDEDGFDLDFRNCPFIQVAELTDYFCQKEKEHIEDILGTPVERVLHRLEGDNLCRYRMCLSDEDT